MACCSFGIPTPESDTSNCKHTVCMGELLVGRDEEESEEREEARGVAGTTGGVLGIVVGGVVGIMRVGGLNVGRGEGKLGGLTGLVMETKLEGREGDEGVGWDKLG